MRVAVTGHRPQVLGADFELRSEVWTFIRNQLGAAFDDLGATTVLSGMALGVDQVAAQLAIDTGRRLAAYVPFDGQHRRWPVSSQRRYEQLIAAATEVTVVSPGGYAAWKMHARNTAMIDHADALVAVWDGRSAGGTYEAVTAAESRGTPIIYIDPISRTRR